MKMQTVDKRRGWTLRQVIFLAILAIFFGVIYEAWSFAYYVLAATPFKAFANDATLGVWLMGGALAGIILRKKGAALLGEFLASVVEMVLFSSWGVATLLYGLMEGVATELGFTLTGYRNWSKVGLTLSVITGTIITFAYDLVASGYNQYSLGMLVALFFVRLVSVGFFAGVLVYWIGKLLDKSGMI